MVSITFLILSNVAIFLLALEIKGVLSENRDDTISEWVKWLKKLVTWGRWVWLIGWPIFSVWFYFHIGV